MLGSAALQIHLLLGLRDQLLEGKCFFYVFSSSSLMTCALLLLLVTFLHCINLCAPLSVAVSLKRGQTPLLVPIPLSFFPTRGPILGSLLMELVKSQKCKYYPDYSTGYH